MLKFFILSEFYKNYLYNENLKLTQMVDGQFLNNIIHLK